MSPASCLVRQASTERRKKRVRFSDDSTASVCPACPATALDSPPLNPTPSSSPLTTTDDLTSSSGDLTRVTEVEVSALPDWGVTHSSGGSWGEIPDLPSDTQLDMQETYDLEPAWWSRKVSLLGVTAPLTVLPSVPCQDAVDIMHQEGYDQLPVVDQPGQVLGIVTLASLMSALIIQRVQPASPVSQVMCREFQTISRDQTLGNLSAIFQDNHFALIVHNQRRMTAKRYVATRPVVIGIVTQIDLLAHITGCLAT